MSRAFCYSVFDTPVGRCAIVWSDRGIAGVQLPGAGDAAARARIGRKFSEASERQPPEEIASVVARIRGLLMGERDDLADIALDMACVDDFARKVYDIARAIRPGETRTYGEVAKAIGDPGAARAVGHALGQNPFPIIVPCHRVLARGGRTGGFSAPGGVDTKLRLLEIEGARINATPSLFDGADARWR